MQNATAIPRETALGLCQEIRRENLGKWYTLRGIQCRICGVFSGGDDSKRRFTSRADCQGCGLVNARYETLPQQAEQSAVAEVVIEAPPEPAYEAAPVIYLPPAGFSATQRRRTCVGCGRQFRIAASQPETDYCPTCDYRRLRGQLIQQAGDDEADEVEE